MDIDLKSSRQQRQERNYPLNCWWVAATAAEVTREPLGRWLLDMPVVLYRNEAGEAVALDNRCLHRWAPLSGGWLEGDNIVCPYHGARFAPDGQCVLFPTQKALPSTAKLRSYPLVERGPFLWIWMGDPARADGVDLPPELAWASDPDWTAMGGSVELEANYMLLHENVLDLTHFNYLHRNSFQITNRTPPSYHVDGNRVYFTESYNLAEMTEEERQSAQMKGPFEIRHEEEGVFETPAMHFVTVETYREPNPMLPEQSLQYIVHLLTPISANRSHYWWQIGFEGQLPPEAVAILEDITVRAFHEDKDLLGSIQYTIDHDPRGRDFPEFSFDGDAGGILARRALDRIMAAD